MSDVSVNIGTDSGQVNGSDISIGSVTGSDHHGLDHLSNRVSELGTRVQRIEELLGGNTLGIPGLTQQVIAVKEMTFEIKQELSEIRSNESRNVPYSVYIFLGFSIFALSTSVVVMMLGARW